MNWRHYLLLVVAPCVVLAALIVAFPSGGQDAQYPEHFWIQENTDYRAPNGTHCCGPEHCFPVQQGEVERRPNGWFHVPTRSFLHDDQQGVYDSEDERSWRCVWDERMQCFFRAGRT